MKRSYEFMQNDSNHNSCNETNEKKRDGNWLSHIYIPIGKVNEEKDIIHTNVY